MASPHAAAAGSGSSSSPAPEGEKARILPPSYLGLVVPGAPAMCMTPLALPPPPAAVKTEGGFVQAEIDKPFVFGSAAFFMGKNIPADQHSHKWTVYLRGLENEDLSYFIKSVAFTLHESFTEPTRVLYQAPYEVTETGWGEFSIIITINFHDASGLDPIQLNHMLKLFPPPQQMSSTKKPVIHETYDEFVFVNPSKEWFDILHSGPTRKVDHHPLVSYFSTPEFAKLEDNAVVRLHDVRSQVTHNIDEQRVKLFNIEKDIASYTQRL